MTESNVIRLCFVTEGIVSIANDDKPHEIPVAIGGIGEKLNHFINYVLKGATNFTRTIIKETEFGEQMADGTMTGCLGRIQRNESDFLVGIAVYPIDDYYRVYPYQIVTEGRVMMLSSYEIVEKLDALDTLDHAIHLFSATMYVAVLYMIAFIAFMFLLFSLVIAKVKKRKWKNVLRRIPYEFFSVFVEQGSDFVDEYNWSRKMLLVCLSVFSFFILCVWSNLMSTDAVVSKQSVVVSKQPDVLNNYDDFLHHPDMKPYFIQMWSDHRLFENAPLGSNARKIWERISHDPSSYVIAKPGIDRMMKIGEEVLNGKGAFFINSFGAEFVLTSVVRWKLQDEKFKKGRRRMWRATDLESRVRTMGTVMRTDFRETVLGKQLIRRARYGTEIGMTRYFMYLMDQGMFQEEFKDPPEMREFLRKTISTKEMVNDFTVHFVNSKNLLKTFTYGMFWGLVVLSLEILLSFMLRKIFLCCIRT